jgi:hypothetical protein
MIMHALAASISVSPAIPGITNVSQTSPGGWIAGIYKFALIVSGMYATSAGNASRQAEGRSWIWSALIGLLLLAGAYIILQTINPNLTNLQIAPLSSVNTQQTTGQ